MKTLVVSYLPKGESSNTKLLADEFVKLVGRKNISHLDLLTDPPDFFTEESMDAYLQRNFGGKKISSTQTKTLAKMDRFTKQLKAHDVIVMVFPTHNFSVPAPIKAYFDSVMLHGETHLKGKGLMQGKKALILVSSGIFYQEDRASWEHAVSLSKNEFEYMGFSDIRAIHAQGTLMGDDAKTKSIAKAQEEIRQLVKEWYGEKNLSRAATNTPARHGILG